ncbi:hypothetical protein [uncultured Mediterranean phage uvMED]|nr:MAG: hypothetical protein CBD88_00180 [Flavobacteriales bacterium TMED228]BAQ87725.1 hypothetical protein [uncultured Mediterranean phage uvMED]BAQ87768.1 hypothetical protein [uncultured Mediterranean phage uvMED]
MKSILDLKKEFKKRNLRLSHCQESLAELNDFLTIELLRHNNVDATLVSLVSATMTISSSYNKKQFIIDLLQSALATIESEKYIEDGKKLN